MVVYLAKKDVDAFNVRIDKIIEGLTEIKVETVGISEHLKTLNGKVATHEQRFTDVFNEFRANSNNRMLYQDNFRQELEKIKKDFVIDNKEQDIKTKKVEDLIWGTKIQVAGIAILVPIIMSFIMWIISLMVK